MEMLYGTLRSTRIGDLLTLKDGILQNFTNGIYRILQKFTEFYRWYLQNFTDGIHRILQNFTEFNRWYLQNLIVAHN